MNNINKLAFLQGYASKEAKYDAGNLSGSPQSVAAQSKKEMKALSPAGSSYAGGKADKTTGSLAAGAKKFGNVPSMPQSKPGAGFGYTAGNATSSGSPSTGIQPLSTLKTINGRAQTSAGQIRPMNTSPTDVASVAGAPVAASQSNAALDQNTGKAQAFAKAQTNTAKDTFGRAIDDKTRMGFR